MKAFRIARAAHGDALNQVLELWIVVKESAPVNGVVTAAEAADTP